MARVLFLMIPPLWGALVLGMGYWAHWNRKRELEQQGLEEVTVISPESAER